MRAGGFDGRMAIPDHEHQPGPIIEREGWCLQLADGAESNLQLISLAVSALAGNCVPFRRSRHAINFQLSIPSNDNSPIYLKCFNPPSTWERMKAAVRGSRAARTERISASLTAAGFAAPKILLRGLHRHSGREVLATARLDGDGPLVLLSRLHGAIEAKRSLLDALGAEIGRLHRAGFIHGDLTPFNIRITNGAPPRFAFLDNERTRRYALVGAQRQRIRNLVQLGRFNLPGITRTDRMRVFRAYQTALYRRPSPRLARRVAKLLSRRMHRDGLTRDEFKSHLTNDG